MRAALLVVVVLVVGGCHLSLWSWSSGSGTHELTVPPVAGATPMPTPERSY